MDDAVVVCTERRAFPRYEVTFSFDLRLADEAAVEAAISGETVEAAIGGETVEAISGETVDLSRGGMRGRTDGEVSTGTRCTVCFAHPTGLTPRIRPGWVLRSDQQPDGYEVVVRFEPRHWVRK